ncbi:hypothetical protein LPB137_05525 [Poseidonibacter parvus]|uniref:Lipoprotein n=1 Tax=Poseidonibacter parvus TaxID=1850254 RepID=A0A1P8KLA0_9BACT|nr:hypothetical protein [Poseidonibacter parvus]APW65343.1 hypothetical protein LPB137_05525 [Poseidonibacter parvus]
MIKVILILLLSFNISLFSCASGWDYSDKSFVFLKQRELPFSNLDKNLNSPSVYNDINYKYKTTAKKINLKEWQAYLKKDLKENLDLDTIEQIVYKGKELSLIKNLNTKKYLQFVHNQEEYVTNYYYGKKQTKEKKKEELLINEAIKRINTNINPWLKLRYFYLSIRLAHYKKLNPLKIYKEYKYLLNTKQKTIVKDWIQGIYAGALIKNNNIEKGVYEFSKLFDKNKINWHLSYYNFHHIKTAKQWNNLINIPTTDFEKTKLITLRALNKNSNIIEELKNIYEIDKNSIWFDFLLYRALLDSQHFFDNQDFYVRNFPTQDFINYLQTIKKDDMYLVSLALGYFNLYTNNLKKAKNIASKLLTLRNNHEVQTFNYLVNLYQLKSIDTQVENDIYSQMIQLSSNTNECTKATNDYTFVILEKLYKKQDNKLKEFLSANINYLNNSSFSLQSLNEFNQFIKTKSKSKIDEYLKERYKEQSKIKKVKDKYLFDESLKRTKIKLLINNLQFEKARKIKSEYLNEIIKFNPFNVSIRGNNRSGKTQTYTIKEFLDKITQIKKILKNNPNSVMDNYLYANAIYNLSYFGNSNKITTEYRSVYSFRNKKLELQKVNNSIKYYEKALKYSKKDEFKAKITYMLAKSELALFDINFSEKSKYHYFNTKEISSYDLKRQWSYTKNKVYNNYINNNYGKYFDKLKDEYSNTKYYEEVLKECANLRVYQKSK